MVAISDELPATESHPTSARHRRQSSVAIASSPTEIYVGAPRNAAEARERLDALATWKAEYEVAVSKTVGTLSEKLVSDLSPALREAVTSARVTFDAQLSERLRRAAGATANALESQSLTELAEVSRDISPRAKPRNGLTS